jgi:hypothetical protein
MQIGKLGRLLHGLWSSRFAVNDDLMWSGDTNTVKMTSEPCNQDSKGWITVLAAANLLLKLLSERVHQIIGKVPS